MAKRKAKAALAPQTLEVSGVENGTATITVESVSDATKKDSIEVEVLDLSIDTKGIGQDLYVGEEKVDEMVVYGGTMPDEATIEWFPTYDSGQDGSFTLVAEGKMCRVKGVTAGGGGRINLKVTLDGIEWTAGSRVDVLAVPAPIITKDIPATKVLQPDEILELAVEVNPATWKEGTDKVRWYRDDVELTEQDAETWDTLRIIVYAENANKVGTYQVKLTNAAGVTESTKCVVTVSS